MRRARLWLTGARVTRWNTPRGGDDEAAKKMKAAHIGAVVVVDGGAVFGVVA
jgi:hypothetical protein